MVALCRDHHPEADAGAWSAKELRELKRVGRDRSQALGARFSWMREKLVAVVGGNFYYETPIALRVRSTPVVWFNRDEAGRLLVNLRMPTTSGEPRMLMLDNFWMTEGSAEREIVCPPSGRLVSAKYPNGDRLKIEFRELADLQDLDRRFPPVEIPESMKVQLESRGIALPDLPSSHEEIVQTSGIDFPIASVEITMEVAGTDLSFGPRRTEIATNTISGSWVVGGPVGIQIGQPEESRPGTEST